MRTMMNFIAALLVVAVVGQPVISQDSADPPSADLPSPASLRAQALVDLQQGDQESALAGADRMVKANPDDPRTQRTAGDIYLRCGKCNIATRLFNQFIKAQPEEMPYLWQRGISLYFTGDYQDAAKQFEDHRKVNPNDVENAAWHFLCVAKAKSVAEAKRLVLPAPGDPRIPLQEVLEMLSNGDTAAVKARIESTTEGSAQRASAEFYGYFYLGLYADALGDQAKAKEHLKRSAKDAPHHYMGDVARVYAEYLAK